MKRIYYLTSFLIFTWLMACKESPKPGGNDLSGTWILFERQVREGNAWVSKPIASSSPQLITFTYPHQVLTTMADDTTLGGVTHFEFGGGGTGIVGPFILFKKNADSPTGRSFYYGNITDTLRLFEFGQAGDYRYYQYGFRRL